MTFVEQHQEPTVLGVRALAVATLEWHHLDGELAPAVVRLDAQALLARGLARLASSQQGRAHGDHQPLSRT